MGPTIGDNFRNLCLLLILLGHSSMVDCTFFMDLIDNLASDDVNCLVVISEHKSESDFMIDTTHLSRISLSLFDIKTSPLEISAAGKDCLYNLLIFDNVNSSLQFFNR